MKKQLIGFLALLAFTAQSQAAFIDFDSGVVAGSPNSNVGNFTYDGKGGTLNGINIPIVSVTGIGTNGTLLAGMATPIPNGTLNFTTGNYIGNDGGNGWTFAAGGSFVITGNVPNVNSLVTQLFVGTFSQQTTIIDTGSGNFKVVSGGIQGQLNATLASLYNVPSDVAYTGAFTMLISASAISGGSIQNTTLTSGNTALNVLNGASVPEPSSFVLCGIGISCMLITRYRRRAA